MALSKEDFLSSTASSVKPLRVAPAEPGVYLCELIPLFAAGYAHAVGFWNEYVPKASLLVLLAPALLAIAAVTQLRLRYVLPMALICGYLGSYLWNGYVDAYVAIYAVAAALAIRNWLADSDGQWLILGALAAGVSLSLKQEGMIVVAALVSATLAATGFTELRGRLTTVKPAGALRAVVVLALMFGPMILWRIKVVAWDLYGDMRPARFLDQLIGRVTDSQRLLEDLTIMADYALSGTYVFEAGAATVVLIGAMLVRGALTRRHIFLILTACAYAAAVLIIYFGTHNDFAWQIETSFLRVTLTVVALFLVAHFEMLDTFLRSNGKALGGAP